MRYLLYNPFSGKENQSRTEAERYENVANVPVKSLAITEIDDMRAFFEELELCDDIVIFGGDGTLNRFVNKIAELHIPNDVRYFPCGTGNDFAREFGKEKGDAPFSVKEYIAKLPTVTINGKTCYFINGIGFGIDGYCCEEGDRLRALSTKPVDYTAIAIKGLLFHYKPTNAKVTVDGKEYNFKKVWIAPTMCGKYYGGGMLPAPAQDRNDPEGKLSVMLFHGSGKIHTLIMFPSLFKGEHIKYKKHVTVLEGHNITVEFDGPRPLQIDGETVVGVTSYNAVSHSAPEASTQKEAAEQAV